ncbi:MAG TPA: right-handed parallel beta-helix repeat-containing protein, partial [Acidimicrobiales bacterium]|nr:right-handed parallel beta-helix repeat-containing protein [Acidimicrobiales bacterium]
MSSKARFWAARLSVAMYLAAALLLVRADGSRALTFTVTTTADSGPGSLRQAISDANQNPGADTIEFEIPSPPATFTILLQGQLPDITSPVTIDATTQTGYVDRPVVEVRGPVPASPGLVLAGGSTPSVVRGLALTQFSIAIVLSADGNAVAQSWIGLGTDGAPRANVTGIQVNGSANTVGPGNVISANSSAGISIAGSDNIVIGNRIGTDPSGAAAAGNLDAGVVLDGGAARNRIGGTVALDRNVISGNAIDGIRASGATGTTILGNYVGTDVTGGKAVGNTTGIRLQNSPATIGGTAPGAGNVVSGNTGPATGISVTSSSGTVIQGNFIGTDASGAAALGNAGAGISLDSGRIYLIADNVIAGNGGATGPATGIEAVFLNDLTIQGNRIGIGATGAALANGTGIFLGDTVDVRIGGTALGQGNIISGNQGPGVDLPCFELPDGPIRTTIQGNLIGTDPAGTAGVPNLEGITVGCGVDTLVGGTVAGAGNVIAFNTGDGVPVAGGTGTSVRQNSIHDNGGLGIDLNDDGPSANDPGDPDAGANLTQNFPVLSSAVGTGGVATITGTLDAQPGTYVVEFYGNPTGPDAEGQTYLGSIGVTVVSGPTSFSAPGIPL